MFKPAWKPGSQVKIYGSGAAPGGMKNYRLSQLAGQLMEGTGAIPGEEQYAKKIVLSTENPPMVEVTLGIAKVFVEGRGCMPMSNKRVNPDSVMGLRNVVTGGTVVTHPTPRTSPMPVRAAHLSDYAGVAEVALIPETLETPTKEAAQAHDNSQPQVTPLQQAMAQQAMEAVARSLLTPVSAVKAAGEPKTAGPGPKRAKKTPGSTSTPGSPAGDLEMSGRQVSVQGKEVFHDAAEKMDVDGEGDTQ